MKEFIEKLICRLEEEKGKESDYSSIEGKKLVRHWNNCVDVCKEIVNKLAEEYKQCALCYLQSPCEYQNENAMLQNELLADKGGWIPCSERFPEEQKTKDGNIDPSEEVLVYIYYGEKCVNNGCAVSRYWSNSKLHPNPWIDLRFGTENVIAWQPLPAPYEMQL